MTDYLAIANLPYGVSVFGRSPDKTKAVETCRKEIRSSAKYFGGLNKDAKAIIHIFDVNGHDQVRWDHTGITGDGYTPIPPPEVITTPLNTRFAPTPPEA